MDLYSLHATLPWGDVPSLQNPTYCGPSMLCYTCYASPPHVMTLWHPVFHVPLWCVLVVPFMLCPTPSIHPPVLPSGLITRPPTPSSYPTPLPQTPPAPFPSSNPPNKLKITKTLKLFLFVFLIYSEFVLFRLFPPSLRFIFCSITQHFSSIQTISSIHWIEFIYGLKCLFGI